MWRSAFLTIACVILELNYIYSNSFPKSKSNLSRERSFYEAGSNYANLNSVSGAVYRNISHVEYQGYSMGLLLLPTLPTITTTISAFEKGIGYYPVATVPPQFCRSTTARANMDCPCLLIGQVCLAPNSLCRRDPNGDGFCGCNTGFVRLNNTCVTTLYYTQTVLQPFNISTPVLVASCFLPANGVFATIPNSGFTVQSYNLTLLFSTPLGNIVKHVDIDPATGNIFLKFPPPSTVTQQTYQVIGKSASGNYSTLIFKVNYNCTAPTCSVDRGNVLYVECQLVSVGSQIATVLASGSIAPTTFSMTRISTTSTIAGTYYVLDQFTGAVQIAAQPHGGIFTELFNVTATNRIGQSCSTIQIRITTSSDCV